MSDCVLFLFLKPGVHPAVCSLSLSADDLNTSLLLPSGFIQEELQDPADLGASGFLPETTRTDPPDYHTGALAAIQLRTESNSHTSVRARAHHRSRHRSVPLLSALNIFDSVQ